MISVRKSPNMMSTTGRMPVIAAPRPRPVMPGSEIGESITRSVPNSSTRPESTLNGVPASATSSPITNTVGSRRSSSRKASLTACASVSSRVDMVRHLARGREGRIQGVLHCVLDLGPDALAHPLELSVVAEPRREQRDRVALARPALLLFLRPVVGAVDVADVMAVVAIGRAHEEARALAAPCPRDRTLGRLVDREHVLAVDLVRRDPERLRARTDRAGGDVLVARVLV